MNPLSVGNSAKLYCLKWIENFVRDKSDAKILDLGCGDALNFVPLLKLYPNICYFGIEPDKKSFDEAKKNLNGLNAEILNINAYNLKNKLSEKFDILTSFSVLEHILKRLEYLEAAKKFLKDDGHFLINYDSGHFTSGQEKLKNALCPIFALFGIEKYYQSFVSECDFRNMIDKVGFKIIDEKFFNTNLKTVFKIIPDDKKVEIINRWLEFEIYLNNLGIKYDDSKAVLFGTRNFILVHK